MKSKNAYVIDFYEQFKCIGGSCPYTCCKGWQIAVDDETFAEYKKAAFPRNIAYRAMTGRKEGTIRCIRKLGERCPFYTTQGLCSFQEAGNEQLMPKVCRQYPRTSICFGQYNEVTLELSCIRAAELFIENLGRHDFVRVDDAIDENWTIGNDATAFLDFLKADRNKLLGYIWQSQKSIWEKLDELYKYSYIVNQYLSRDDLKRAEAVSLPITSSLIGEFSVPKISSSKLRREERPLYPIWFVNEIIYEKLTHPKMKARNRYLYDLIRLYEKIFGDLTEKEADSFFTEKMQTMVEKQPELELFFNAYLAYLIQQMYCKAYEDYYVLGQILLAIIDVEFVMLFVLTYYLEKDRVEPADLAAILANTERAIRHNLSLNDDILYKIREKFFK